jgi:heme iron utilization protein
MPDNPVPVRAQKARSLLHRRGFGVLATISKKMPGFPFASVTPFSVDEQGRALFLFSGLALHTKNLLEEPKASLLVFEPEAESDPLNSARMNVFGEVHPVPKQDLDAARELYLADHPDSEQWIGFGDFTLYRLEVADVYFVGGFGEMGWVAKGDFAAAGTSA